MRPLLDETIQGSPLQTTLQPQQAFASGSRCLRKKLFCARVNPSLLIAAVIKSVCLPPAYLWPAVLVSMLSRTFFVGYMSEMERGLSFVSAAMYSPYNT